MLYVAKLTEAVYVLDAFKKRTRKASLHDIALARERFRALVAWRRAGKRGER